MIKQITIGIFLLLSMLESRAVESFYKIDYLPSAPAAAKPGSTAIHRSSNAIVAWADGFTNLQYGTDVDEVWMTPEKALGAAEGTAFDVVSLGRGGRITLTFPSGIGDGLGADFSVFENGISDEFLELAYVEVSSDGIHFVRFPNYSDTPYEIGAYAGLLTQWIHGLASKYEGGYGTPFDLNELRLAYNAQLAGNTDFSPVFAAALTNGFPKLNLEQITHVRLIDIIGDGTALDARGSVIYDPYATIGSAGFDLDAVGVIHSAGLPEEALPTINIVSVDGFFTFEYAYDYTALSNAQILSSADFSVWTNTVPEIIGQETNGVLLSTTNRIPADATNRFFKVQLDVR